MAPKSKQRTVNARITPRRSASLPQIVPRGSGSLPQIAPRRSASPPQIAPRRSSSGPAGAALRLKNDGVTDSRAAGSAIQAVRQARLDVATVPEAEVGSAQAQAAVTSTASSSNCVVDAASKRESDGPVVDGHASMDQVDEGVHPVIRSHKPLPDTSRLSSSLDDTWNEFKSKFDNLTKGLVSKLGGLLDAPTEEGAAEHLRRLSEASAEQHRRCVAADNLCESARNEVCTRLQSTKYMDNTDSLFWHGRAYSGPITAPIKTWDCDRPPRDDHHCPSWLTASEFQDSSEVIEAKVAQLASLMRISRRTVIYTGAGISASVVGQAALSGMNSVGFLESPLNAQPTFTHHALGLLGMSGFIHSWVQQNHDGLPQKAGFPQDRINEVHGSWYDPSNPVVKYNGSLKPDAHDWMLKDAETADLVIVLGSSLGGLNADRVPAQAAERSLQISLPSSGQPVPGNRLITCLNIPGPHYYGTVIENKMGSLRVRLDDDERSSPVEIPTDHQPMQFLPSGGLGTACINLQQTPCDGMMTLRLFGTSDDILRLLLKELGLGVDSCVPRCLAGSESNCILVPYGPSGDLLPPEEGKRMWLNLNDGLEVRITEGHNIQGAKQPKYLHIGASKPVTFLACTRAPAEPCGLVRGRDDNMHAFVLDIAGVDMNLGIWWLEVAMRGGVKKLPVVNQYPRYEGEVPEGPKEVHVDERAWWEKGETATHPKLKKSLSGDASDPTLESTENVLVRSRPQFTRKSSF